MHFDTDNRKQRVMYMKSPRLTGMVPVRQKELMEVHFPLGVNTDFV